MSRPAAGLWLIVAVWASSARGSAGTAADAHHGPAARFVRITGVAAETIGPRTRTTIPPWESAPARVHAAAPAAAITMGRYRVSAGAGGLLIVPDTSATTCHGDRVSAQVAASGFLPLTGSVDALAVWGRTIYAAIGSGGRRTGSRGSAEIVVIDARRPDAPVLHRRVARKSGASVAALGVIGSRLYVLTSQGLEVGDITDPGSAAEHHPEIRGTSLQVMGRLLRVRQIDGSTAVYRDASGAPLRWEVSVNEDFYSPQDLVIDVGDEVRWSNASGTSHNVVSCTADLEGCDGATTAEPFDSGDPALFFVYDHVFTQSGANPYACEPHPYMTGSVTVLGSSGSPPGVPDGITGAAMTVQRNAADGSVLAISWGAAACSGAADFEILYGYPYGLPPATGSGYEPAGSRCDIGTVSPFTWQNAPPAFPGPSGLLWWLVIATDGAATEGSWGKAASGLERQGPGPGGASLECGIVAKSLANPCGH